MVVKKIAKKPKVENSTPKKLVGGTIADDNPPLRAPFSIKLVDLRKALGVAPATMSEIIKEFDPSATAKRGVARSIAPSVVRQILAARGYKFPRLAKRISVMISKGGNGKTTIARNLGQRLSSYGFRVLLVDTDMQGNLTSAFSLEELGFEIDTETYILHDVLAEDSPLDDAIVRITENLDIVPSTSLNSMLDVWIDRQCKNQTRAFVDKIEAVRSRYDYIIFDCAPALSRTNSAAIGSSDMVILPVIPDKFSQHGLEQTIKEIKLVQREVSHKIACKVVFNRFDAREATSVMYLGEVASTYKNIMFNTMIRTSADLKNSIAMSKDLFDDYRSTARFDIDELTREITELAQIVRPQRKPGRRSEQVQAR